jgi:lactate permease
MCAAKPCGSAMGKMISSQSIVVASTTTNRYGHEGRIVRYVFLLSIILAAYVSPFTGMVTK